MVSEKHPAIAVAKTVAFVAAAAMAAGITKWLLRPVRNDLKELRESIQSANEASLQMKEAQNQAIRKLTLSSSPEITVDQNEKYVWIYFKIGEKHLEPEAYINLDKNDGNVLLIKINDIQKAYKLPAAVKWPVYWKYDYEDSKFTLELERVEPVTSDENYWKALDENFQKSADQQLIYEKQTSNSQFEMKYDTYLKMVGSPFVVFLNVQFDPDHSLHTYANYPFGTYYEVYVTASDNSVYIYKLFPIPRELLEDNVTNKETFLNSRNNVISTGEIQRLFIEYGFLENKTEIGESDLRGRVKVERMPIMLLKDTNNVAMKEAVLNIPAGHKVVFFAVSTAVTTFFETFLHLCLYTNSQITLLYITSAERYQIHHEELNKMVAICGGKFEFHRLHPGKAGISQEEEQKRFPNGAIDLNGITEITSNIINYKSTHNPVEDTIFISATKGSASYFKEFLVNDYGYSEENIYCFYKNPRLLEAEGNH